jgi:hypothetical protein
MWTNPFTGWVYQQEKLLSNINPMVAPLALRYQGFIDIYCADLNQNLIHLWANDFKDWQYQN